MSKIPLDILLTSLKVQLDLWLDYCGHIVVACHIFITSGVYKSQTKPNTENFRIQSVDILNFFTASIDMYVIILNIDVDFNGLSKSGEFTTEARCVIIFDSLYDNMLYGYTVWVNKV